MTDKKTKAVEEIIAKHDSFIRDLNVKILIEKDAIKKHSHRAEVFDSVVREAEYLRDLMVKIVNESLN